MRYDGVMPATTVDPVLERLRAFGAALRDVWLGYWDRPIGC
jgi:hypothetical protein